MKENISKKLAYLEFVQRENSKRHHTFEEEMLQYEYIKNGDIRSIDESKKIFNSNLVGHLSDDPLRNMQYMFVCYMTLVTRFVIEGGMEPENAYNASDLYIQSIDKAKSIDEILEIHSEMVLYFTKHMAQIKKQSVYSKQIVICMDYIYYHLHQNITGTELAEIAGLNHCYLSTLFKKETGMNISEYICRKRMEASENMLKYSDYSLSEIGEFLAFSTYSHFARVFRKYHGMSPKEFRTLNFRQTDVMKAEGMNNA
jgi:YesN/AraC family two-component response regulator